MHKTNLCLVVRITSPVASFLHMGEFFLEPHSLQARDSNTQNVIHNSLGCVTTRRGRCVGKKKKEIKKNN